MNIGVVGSRSFEDYDLLTRTLDRVRQMFPEHEITIVSGGAAGADTLAAKYADDVLKKKATVFLPDVGVYGSPAAYKHRNRLIVEESDFVVAFWNGVSRGTHDTMNKTTKAGKPILVVPFEAEPLPRKQHPAATAKGM